MAIAVEKLAWGDDLPAVGEEVIPPSAKGVVRALSNIGYKLSEALSDLIDNSIDAGASQILVRFYFSPKAVERVVIADNGKGMADARMHDAMQFGADSKHSETDLGKFGMGLKTASFSQCDRLSVLSRQKKAPVAGRRWDREQISKGWACARLDPKACAAKLDEDWGNVNATESGTLIIWDRMAARLAPRSGDTERYVRNMLRGNSPLSLHLGMTFHRFIETKQISIVLEGVKVTEDSGFTYEVRPINPFAYEQSGQSHYPKDFTVQLGSLGALKIRAHVLPPRSKSVEYKLGGKAAERQGFYFYRNDRLIQAGGWNGLREQEAEPHLSLARVAVDLPSALDETFSLETQKSGVEVPMQFKAAVDACSARGVTFSQYIKDAQTAYRRKPETPQARPIVLGKGVPSKVRERSIREFAEQAKHTNDIQIQFLPLDAGTFFAIKREEGQLVINRAYSDALGGHSANDGGLVKSLLFLLLRDEFTRHRVTQENQRWLEQCNAMLMAGYNSQTNA